MPGVARFDLLHCILVHYYYYYAQAPGDQDYLAVLPVHPAQVGLVALAAAEPVLVQVLGQSVVPWDLVHSVYQPYGLIRSDWSASSFVGCENV